MTLQAVMAAAPTSGGQASDRADYAALNLPGLGPQLRASIQERLGPGGLQDCLEARDVARLGSVPGVGRRRAITWTASYHGLRTMETFACTPEAQRVWKGIQERLAACAATPQGKDALAMLPLHDDVDAAAGHAEQVMAAADEVAALADANAVASALARIRPLVGEAPRSMADVLVVCETPAIEDDLHKRGLARHADVVGPEGLRRADEAELVLFVYDEGELDVSGLDNVLEVPAGAADAVLVPHALKAWALHHAATIRAMADLESATGRPGPAADIARLLADEPTSSTAPASPKLSQGDLDKLAKELTDQVRAEVETSMASLALSGGDLLAALRDEIPAPVQALIRAAIKQAEDAFEERTGLRASLWHATLPPTLDDEELRCLAKQYGRADALQKYRRDVEVAKLVEQSRRSLQDSALAWLRWDRTFALGRFVLRYNLRPATWGDCLAVRDSIHLGLAGDRSAQRLAYTIGGGPSGKGCDQRANVALLTGANSGGKSTLLEHLAQVTMMAHAGLPVVGSCVVPWLDAVHLMAPRRGLDAGAFETFLTTFMPLANCPGRNLVLADELEATTELEAAGRILGFWIDRMAKGHSLAVVVTHVAPQILVHVQAPVRVDGIEATGLDGNNKLIVERCPRMGHLARSTPELIVQRLAATNAGGGAGLFAELLDALRNQATERGESQRAGGSPR